MLRQRRDWSRLEPVLHVGRIKGLALRTDSAVKCDLAGATLIRPLSSLAAALLFFASPLSAHDFWIQPSTYRPEVGETLLIHLRVGQHFLGDPLPRSATLIERFVAVSPSGQTDIAGVEGRDPAGTFPVTKAEDLLIGYRSRPTFVELGPEKLAQYLADEGEERIQKIRESVGKENAPWREIFSRCAKSLLASGNGRARVFNKVLGFRLELIPGKDPSRSRAGSAIPVLLQFDGQPLAGALVVAINSADPLHPLRMRTDARGQVSLTLPQAGEWMFKAVHIFPAPAGGKAEWESLWASLTFELPARKKL